MQDFNPRHPCGWRRVSRIDIGTDLFISIHATHAGGDMKLAKISQFVTISIHATHAGGDACVMTHKDIYEISIHATHAGGDFCNLVSVYV